MATTQVKIGHASTYRPSAGAAAAEVLISNYYTDKWTVVLRPKTAELAEKSALTCEAGCTNNKIEYSQTYRNTLKQKAENVNYDLSKITETCYADCSSFMTVCAIAGGAKIPYGSNAPTTSTMRRVFSTSGYYTVFTDNAHLTSSDYLKRGDILVKEGAHTVMILTDGANYASTGIPAISVDTSNTKIRFIDLILSGITSSSVTIHGAVLQKENNKKDVIDDSNFISNLKWSYTIKQLKNNKETIKMLNVKPSATIDFTADQLTPNSSYVLTVQAKNGSDTISSHGIIFTTLQEKPGSVKDLSVTFEKFFMDDCVVSFTAPKSWPNSSNKGYRVSFIVNGKIAAHDDNIIAAAGSNKINKKLQFKNLDKFKNIELAPDDHLQLGIQAWVDIDSDKVFDNDFPVCSEIINIIALNKINNIFLKIKDSFRLTTIYNNRQED